MVAHWRVRLDLLLFSQDISSFLNQSINKDNNTKLLTKDSYGDKILMSSCFYEGFAHSFIHSSCFGQGCHGSNTCAIPSQELMHTHSHLRVIFYSRSTCCHVCRRKLKNPDETRMDMWSNPISGWSCEVATLLAAPLSCFKVHA